jgi:hypothetical protein
LINEVASIFPFLSKRRACHARRNHGGLSRLSLSAKIGA